MAGPAFIIGTGPGVGASTAPVRPRRALRGPRRPRPRPGRSARRQAARPAGGGLLQPAPGRHPDQARARDHPAGPARGTRPERRGRRRYRAGSTPRHARGRPGNPAVRHRQRGREPQRRCAYQADSARRPIHWMIAEGARRPLRGLSGPPVSDLATQDHSARSGQLAEVAAGVGVIDDSIGGCAFAQPGYPQVRTCRPGTCADGQLGRHSRAGQSADLAGHPAARPRVGTGQKNHPRFGGCGGQLAMQCAPARYHCLRGLSGRWRT